MTREAHCFVLVLGGGLAGLMAALAVKEQGKSVAIASLGPVGKSGNTLVSGGGIAGVVEGTEDSVEDFLRDIMASGKGLADAGLAAILAEQSGAMLRKLEDLGVALARDNGKLRARRPPGHSVPRNIPTDWTGKPYAMRGITFMEPVAQRLEQDAVPMMHGVRAVALLRDGDRVCGALVCDRKSGELRRLYADRVILATGGYGGLYSRNNNVSDMYGDGISLALQAGCAVRDMEMVQFYPTMMFSPVKMPISNPLFGAGAVLRNSTGERFMSRYDPAGDMATRDSMARAIFMEVSAGRGVDGCAQVDCSAIPPDTLHSQFGSFCRNLAKQGLNPQRDMLLGTPCVHYSLGGVVIDAWGRTTLPGLYAAGELCGGVHGANRLSGAALMEAAVFGWRAGLAAAEDALAPWCSGAAADDTACEVSQETKTYLAEQLKNLRICMWENVSLVRDAAGLSQALATISSMRDAVQLQPPCLEQRGLLGSLLVAESIVRSAQARTESRGAHYRTDYPARDEALTGSIHCRLYGEGVETAFVPAAT